MLKITIRFIVICISGFIVTLVGFLGLFIALLHRWYITLGDKDVYPPSECMRVPCYVDFGGIAITPHCFVVVPDIVDKKEDG